MRNLRPGHKCGITRENTVFTRFTPDRREVSLAREWLVSWVMVQLGLTKTTQLDARHRIENVVNSEANEYVNAKQSQKEFRPLFLVPLPQIEEVLSLWLTLTNVRNDIDHAGMRDEAGKPEDLIKRIQSCLGSLDLLPV